MQREEKGRESLLFRKGASREGTSHFFRSPAEKGKKGKGFSSFQLYQEKAEKKEGKEWQ